MESKNAIASSHHTSALQACLREAIAEGPKLIQSWIKGLSDELSIRESGASNFRQRTDLVNSQTKLNGLKTELQTRWTVQWEQAIQDGLKNGHQNAITGRRSFSQIRFEELELMGDEQIQATVEIARIQQTVQLIADQALGDLSARMSRAQGLSVVRAGQNPLRPEIVVQALTQTLDMVCHDASIRSVWLQYGSKALGNELAVFYRHLCHLLDRHGVMPAEYGPVQSPSGMGGTRSTAGSSATPTAGQASHPTMSGRGGDAWGNTGHGMLNTGPPLSLPKTTSGDFHPSSLLTLNHLHQLLMTEKGGGLPAPPAASDTAATSWLQGVDHGDDVPLPSLVLTEDAGDHLPTIPHPGPYADDSTAPDPKTYQGPERRRRRRGVVAPEEPALGKLSLNELAEEVVGLMLDGIAQDERLLPPVSTSLHALRPALLQVARQEPRFFADRENPARRLLDEMTQRSLAFASTDSPGFSAFMERLNEAVGTLSAEMISQNAALNFERALCALDAPADTVPHVLEAQEAAQDLAVASLLNAEQRYLVAEKIAQKIQTRKDFGHSPVEVQQFLSGPWSQVVAQARMSPSADDTGIKPTDERYMNVVLDVLWSCQLELASRNRARLVRVIPGLLRQLREGLISIEYPAEEAAPFFARLMACHETALRSHSSDHTPLPSTPVATPGHGAPHSQARAKNSALEDTSAPDTQPDPHPGPWLSPTEIRDTHLLEVAASAHGADFAPTQPMSFESSPAAWASDTVAADLLPHDAMADLRVGAWIEIEQVAGERQRARLKWASPHGNMYLFIRTDGKSISMTRRMYQSLLNQQRVRLVAEHSMVDDALDGVMAAAVRNSTSGP